MSMGAEEIESLVNKEELSWRRPKAGKRARGTRTADSTKIGKSRDNIAAVNYIIVVSWPR